MSHNEALLGELRRYLGSAQSNPGVKESEQVLALKQDLNLAARVGQQLLMQLQAAEKQNKAYELKLEEAKAKNARLLLENQRLAAEHELLTETLEGQDAEIATLVQDLQDSMQRSSKLHRVEETARLLEKEIQLLEQMQADLQSELEMSTQAREAAERVAHNLARHVSLTFNSLRLEMGLPALPDPEAPAESDVTADETADTTTDTTADSTPAAPELTNDTTTNVSMEPSWTAADSTGVSSVANISLGKLSIQPVEAGTPLRPNRPQMHRALSHESVLSLAPPAPLWPLVPARHLDAALAQKAVTGISDDHSFTASSSMALPKSLGSSSARDRLSQMAPDRKPRVVKESRWHFTPFRSGR